MYTVFLTGGIGSGKSTVRELLRAKGAWVLDLDEVGHDVLRDPQVKVELARRFGKQILKWEDGMPESCLELVACECSCDDESYEDPRSRRDSWGFASSADQCIVDDEVELDAACLSVGEYAEIDRKALAEAAFLTPEGVADLNAITHPRIIARMGSMLTGVCCMAREPRVAVVEVPIIEGSPEALSLADEVMAVACPTEVRREHAVVRGMDAADFDSRDASQIDDEARAAIADTVLLNVGSREELSAQVDAWWERRRAGGWASPRARADAGLQGACDGQGERREWTPELKSPSIAFVGRHNSGKTTLVTAVIAELVARGVDVGSVKHHGHKGFDIDVPGKDSWRHREAGAVEVAVCSPDKFALTRELVEPMECSAIVDCMLEHDVVIVEGYRHSGVPAIEIMRSGNERDRIAADEFVRATAEGRPFEFDPTVLGHDADRMPDGLTVGVASDIPEVLEAAVACGLEPFRLDDAASIADFVQAKVARRNGRPRA